MPRSATRPLALFSGMSILVALVASCAPSNDGGATAAEDSHYPSKPITWIVPSDPAGGSDTVTRAMLPFLAEELGVDEITVRNEAGGGGEIGHTQIFENGGDCYTLGTLLAPHYAITTIQSNPPYGLDDFAWFNAESDAPGLMVVRNESPYKSFTDVINAAKAGQEVVIGVSALNDHHLLLLYLQKELNVPFRIVPYAGGGEGRAALLGGHVDVYFAPATAQEGVESQARAIAVASAEPIESWPGATPLRDQLNDSSLPGAGTIVGYGSSRECKEKHPEVWQRLADALKAVWDKPEYQAKLQELGRTPYSAWRGPDQSNALVQEGLDFVRDHGDLFGQQ